MLTRLSNRLNSEHRKIIGNTGWLFIGRIFRILISLLVSTWVARYLGPKEFGILQYALAFSSFFLPLSTIQMAPIVTRDLVRQPESSNVILGTAFTLQLVVGQLAAIASITLIFVVSPEDFLVHLLVAIVALKFIFNSLQPIESWFEARVESKFKVLAENVAFIFSTVLKCYLILSGASVVALTIVLVLETLLYSFGLIFYYQKKSPKCPDWRTKLEEKFTILLFENLFPLVLSLQQS